MNNNGQEMKKSTMDDIPFVDEKDYQPIDRTEEVEAEEKSEAEADMAERQMKERVRPKYEPVRFNVNEIPSYIQYDVVPLPSNGQCYRHKKSRIPVKYLTAAEENIYSAPNAYHHGQVIDIILKRCILDKDFDVDDMVLGDRDAIVMWLRQTAYGSKLSVTYKNPNEKGQEVNAEIDLSQFRVVPFTLEGDENGWFSYTTQKGDEIKFRYLTKKDQEDLVTMLRREYDSLSLAAITKNVEDIRAELDAIGKSRTIDDEPLHDALEYIQQWAVDGIKENPDGMVLREPRVITENMIAHTMSVNGNTDRTFIRNYIESMRSGDAKKYREYINEHTPGMDLSVHIDIPESQGGGSIDSTFRYDDTIFISV